MLSCAWPRWGQVSPQLQAVSDSSPGAVAGCTRCWLILCTSDTLPFDHIRNVHQLAWETSQTIPPRYRFHTSNQKGPKSSSGRGRFLNQVPLPSPLSLPCPSPSYMSTISWLDRTQFPRGHPFMIFKEGLSPSRIIRSLSRAPAFCRGAQEISRHCRSQ